MDLRWADSRLAQEFTGLVSRAKVRVWLVTPFISRTGITPLIEALDANHNLDLRLITRLNSADVAAGVIDVAALADFVDAGGIVRCADRGLHAKIWIADTSCGIGSANLTSGGLVNNLEVMLFTSVAAFNEFDPLQWFNRLWNDLASTQYDAAFLRNVADSVRAEKAALPVVPDIDYKDWGKRISSIDYGVADMDHPAPAWVVVGKRQQPFVPEDVIGDEYARVHAAWGFPKGKVPHLDFNDEVFIIEHAIFGRTDDYVVVGRARVAERYDAANNAPKWLRKELTREGYDRAMRWSRIVWLKDVEIVSGTIADCPRFRDLLPQRRGSLRNGRFHLTRGERAIISKALDHAFESVGRSQNNAQEVWWSLFAANGQRFTREYIEQRNREEAEASRRRSLVLVE